MEDTFFRDRNLKFILKTIKFSSRPSQKLLNIFLLDGINSHNSSSPSINVIISGSHCLVHIVQVLTHATIFFFFSMKHFTFYIAVSDLSITEGNKILTDKNPDNFAGQF